MTANVLWCHRSGPGIINSGYILSTFLTVSSHQPYQRRLIVNLTFGNKLQWNFNQVTFSFKKLHLKMSPVKRGNFVRDSRCFITWSIKSYRNSWSYLFGSFHINCGLKISIQCTLDRSQSFFKVNLHKSHQNSPVVARCVVWCCLTCVQSRDKFNILCHGVYDLVSYSTAIHRESLVTWWWNLYDDVIKWNHFPRYWPFVRGIHRSPVNSPHKGQWRGALTFSLICPWTNGCINSRDAGDFRRHRTHYDVTVMCEHLPHGISGRFLRWPHLSRGGCWDLLYPRL